MNKLIVFPLIILAFLNVLGLPLLYEAKYTIEESLSKYAPTNIIGLLLKSVISFTISNFSNVYTLLAVMVSGLLALAFLGIKVAASGIGDVSTEIIVKVVFFSALFGFLSVVPFTLMLSAFGTFGIVFSAFLVLFYFAGVVQNVRGGGGE